jgi:hypothetical protein
VDDARRFLCAPPAAARRTLVPPVAALPSDRLHAARGQAVDVGIAQRTSALPVPCRVGEASRPVPELPNPRRPHLGGRLERVGRRRRGRRTAPPRPRAGVAGGPCTKTCTILKFGGRAPRAPGKSTRERIGGPYAPDARLAMLPRRQLPARRLGALNELVRRGRMVECRTPLGAGEVSSGC